MMNNWCLRNTSSVIKPYSSDGSKRRLSFSLNRATFHRLQLKKQCSSTFILHLLEPFLFIFFLKRCCHGNELQLLPCRYSNLHSSVHAEPQKWTLLVLTGSSRNFSLVWPWLTPHPPPPTGETPPAVSRGELRRRKLLEQRNRANTVN